MAMAVSEWSIQQVRAERTGSSAVPQVKPQLVRSARERGRPARPMLEPSAFASVAAETSVDWELVRTHALRGPQ